MLQVRLLPHDRLQTDLREAVNFSTPQRRRRADRRGIAGLVRFAAPTAEGTGRRTAREGPCKSRIPGAGRAILYAGATSVLGFGTLMLAQHRGLRSFGRTMALGNLFEMIVALIFLPALLSYRSRPRP